MSTVHGHSTSPKLDVYWVNQYAVPPDQPGGTRHYDFATSLQARGHRVRIVASDLNLTTRAYSRRRTALDPRFISEHVNGVEFRWLTAGLYRANDWRRAVSMLIFSIMVFVALMRTRRQAGTVFVGSSPHLFGALATWLAARFRQVPFVLEVRDLWPESYTQMTGRSAGPEIRLMRLIAGILYRRADAIIVLAEGNIEHVVAGGARAERTLYIPNGVDLAAFRCGEASLSLQREGEFSFVYAGAHGPANGLGTVLEAIKEVERQGTKGIRVYLVGDGPDKALLVERAVQLGLAGVTFLDPIPKDAIGPTLATADAALMVLAPVELFSYGVSPNKLFDYLAAGLPVLTNVPGYVASVVEAAGVGFSVQPGDPRALAAGMIAMASDPPRNVRVRGPEFVKANYDRSELSARVERLLGSVVF